MKTDLPKQYNRLVVALIVIVSLAVTVTFGLTRGQDVNWDQHNYHIGEPHLLANGTFWESAAPAGIQSFFNPYVLQIKYFAINSFPPIVVATLVSLVQSTAFMLAGLVSIAVVASSGSALAAGERALLALLGFSLCLLAPVALSEAGTTLIDLVTAVPVIAAYLLLLRRSQIGVFRAAAFAGALIGAATALKLTNAVFAFGVIGFACFGTDSWMLRFRWLLAFGAIAAASFFLVGGSWQFELWQRFGNPFFPYFNNIFGSPDGHSVAMRDGRFLPSSVLDVWRYPLFWLFGGSPNGDLGSPSSELILRDARWAIATFCSVIALFVMVLSRKPRKNFSSDPSLGLLCAVLIAYLVWLWMFSIHRYMAVIDILVGAALLALAIKLPGRWMRLGFLTASVALSSAVIRVPDWGHRDWQKTWQGINPTTADFGSSPIFFLVDKPTFYVAASLPRDSRFVGLVGDFEMRAESNTAFSRLLKKHLSADPPLPLWAVHKGTVHSVATSVLDSYGLSVTDACVNLDTIVEVFSICKVERVR